MQEGGRRRGEGGAGVGFGQAQALARSRESVLFRTGSRLGEEARSSLQAQSLTRAVSGPLKRNTGHYPAVPAEG